MSEPRSIIITGGTGDLGEHCALTLARKYPQYQIIIAARKDAVDIVGKINRTTQQNNVEFLALDLSNLAAVRSFAASWASEDHPPIIALLLNAGVQLPGRLEYTEDGIEKTVGVNHVAHALLFHLLTPYLAEGARIVVTASGTHDPDQKTGVGKPEFFTAEEMAHPTDKTNGNTGMWRYGTSKLVNVMWAYALHRRLTTGGGQLGKNWTVVAYDPGLMPGTGLARGQPAVIRFMWFYVFPHILPVVRLLVYKNTYSPAESGASLAWLAMDGQSSGIAGKYFEQKEAAKSSTASHDVDKQDDLWQWTLDFIAKDGEEKRKFETLS